MKRREFTLGAAAAALPGLLSQPAHAQSGKGYTELGRRAPVEAPPGQVEVVEFFSYGCVHCKNFEPMFGAWSASSLAVTSACSSTVFVSAACTDGAGNVYFSISLQDAHQSA